MERLASLILFLACAPLANATTILVESGQLTGANNVNVSGTLYNVRFLDGTCEDLYNGCLDPADFIFNSVGAATQAALALEAQVFLDGGMGNFDSMPALTRGCDAGLNTCQIATPYSSVGLRAQYVTLANRSGTIATDLFVQGSEFFRTDITGNNRLTWAVWSTPVIGPVAVPLPTPAWLLIAALLAVAISLRKQFNPAER